jgi:hypothetical protein
MHERAVQWGLKNGELVLLLLLLLLSKCRAPIINSNNFDVRKLIGSHFFSTTMPCPLDMMVMISDDLIGNLAIYKSTNCQTDHMYACLEKCKICLDTHFFISCEEDENHDLQKGQQPPGFHIILMTSIYVRPHEFCQQ